MQVVTLAEKLLVGTAVAYIGFMVLVPFANVFFQVRAWRKRQARTARTAPAASAGDDAPRDIPAPAQAFHKGLAVFAEHLLDPDFLHAVKLTLMLAAVAVPINVLFGLVAAINITRNEFPGKVCALRV